MSFYFDAPRQFKIQQSTTYIVIASPRLMTCISAMMICDDPMVRTLGCLIQSDSNILRRIESSERPAIAGQEVARPWRDRIIEKKDEES